MKHTIIIRPNGTAEWVHADELNFLKAASPTSTRRVSDVEPEGDSWTADMHRIGGPLLGPFLTREEALRAERLWLDIEYFKCRDGDAEQLYRKEHDD
jgi:hypothetical protein